MPRCFAGLRHWWSRLSRRWRVGIPQRSMRSRSCLWNVEWCVTELIPHALAEEGPLYGGPGNTEQGRLLVDGMLAEHRAIVNLVEQLRQSEGVRSAVAAGAIHQIFALHLDKENRLLMPLVVQSPTLSLAEA